MHSASLKYFCRYSEQDILLHLFKSSLSYFILPLILSFFFYSSTSSLLLLLLLFIHLLSITSFRFFRWYKVKKLLTSTFFDGSRIKHNLKNQFFFIGIYLERAVLKNKSLDFLNKYSSKNIFVISIFRIKF